MASNSSSLGYEKLVHEMQTLSALSVVASLLAGFVAYCVYQVRVEAPLGFEILLLTHPRLILYYTSSSQPTCTLVRRTLLGRRLSHRPPLLHSTSSLPSLASQDPSASDAVSTAGW